MSKLIPGNQKHLTLEDRSEIERQITLGSPLNVVAALLCKDPTTISKEIKLHRVYQPHNSFKLNFSEFLSAVGPPSIPPLSVLRLDCKSKLESRSGGRRQIRPLWAFITD